MTVKFQKSNSTNKKFLSKRTYFYLKKEYKWNPLVISLEADVISVSIEGSDANLKVKTKNKISFTYTRSANVTFHSQIFGILAVK